MSRTQCDTKFWVPEIHFIHLMQCQKFGRIQRYDFINLSKHGGERQKNEFRMHGRLVLMVVVNTAL